MAVCGLSSIGVQSGKKSNASVSGTEHCQCDEPRIDGAVSEPNVSSADKTVATDVIGRVAASKRKRTECGNKVQQSNEPDAKVRATKKKPRQLSGESESNETVYPSVPAVNREHR